MDPDELSFACIEEHQIHSASESTLCAASTPVRRYPQARVEPNISSVRRPEAEPIQFGIKVLRPSKEF